ncbi:MAG TPA: hypothetical protein VIT93_06925 [Dehalococcoidia bacterium]
MEYRHTYAREPRITLPSILLLAIFISAAAFIVSAIVWQPWTTDDDAVTVPSTADAVTEEPVSDGLDGEFDVLVQPLTE